TRDVQAARHAVGDRRLARGDAGQLLRRRPGVDAGEPDQLRLHAALPARAAGTVSDQGAVRRPRQLRGVAVESGRRVRRLAFDRDRVYALDAAGTWRVARVLSLAGH